MSTLFDDNNDENSKDENWLYEHEKLFQESRKSDGEKSNKSRPIYISDTKQKCPYCGEEAAVELFRNAKCLACQIADYYGLSS